MKNMSQAASKLPDLRNGHRGSVWFSNEGRNLPGLTPAPLLWQVANQASTVSLNSRLP